MVLPKKPATQARNEATSCTGTSHHSRRARGSRSTASATALTHTTVLELYSRDFQKLTSEINELTLTLYESLIKTLINRMRATDELVTRIMYELKPGKLKEAATMRDAITKMILGR